MNYLVNNDWSKNQYQKLNDTHGHKNSTICSIFSISFLSFCLALIILSFWHLNQYDVTNISMISLNKKQSSSHIVSNKFLSLGLDSSLLRNMNDLPISNEILINLAKHLSPAYVRVGGTAADCLFFNKVSQIDSATTIVDGQDINNFTITDVDLKLLYTFAKKSKLRMIFDLNVLIRNPDGSWNYTNAEDIILFAKEHNMHLDWQLGNEPNSFPHVFNVKITAEQLAKDYSRLKNLLKNAGFGQSLLVGPEANHIGDTNHKGEDYITAFLENDENSVDYVTWHQYYLNGHIAKIDDFVNPLTFQYLPMQINTMIKTINATGKSISMWLSETSTAYGGGAPELSDRFVAGFLWLDKLGYSASTGVNVVIRQTLFGENYGMVGSDLLPNPDWWISVVYKQFVSEKVLKIQLNTNSRYLRFYAHCTPKAALINRVPAITIYGINIDKYPSKILIEDMWPLLNKKFKIFFYALTSNYLTSRYIKMNGEVLKLLPNGDLPPFRTIILEASQIITLPAYSMVFLVVHGLEVSACMI